MWIIDNFDQIKGKLTYMYFLCSNINMHANKHNWDYFLWYYNVNIIILSKIITIIMYKTYEKSSMFFPLKHFSYQIPKTKCRLVLETNILMAVEPYTIQWPPRSIKLSVYVFLDSQWKQEMYFLKMRIIIHWRKMFGSIKYDGWYIVPPRQCFMQSYST